ncbi:MAG TPA: methyltransferase domain-containing protein [Pyrinomonadaceae bacterium]|nr:methyltransferase domain-containing protein [Pyrinomonadaceae bacterium]
MLKQLANRSKSVTILFRIYDNWRLRRQINSGNIETVHGSTHTRKSTEESLRYINSQFEDYLNYSGLSAQQLAGKTILELGFGDNLGVALKFIAAGAKRVVCLDRFYSARDTAHQVEIYSALRQMLSEDEKARFDSAIKIGSEIELHGAVQCIYGTSLEQVADETVRNQQKFDLIISRAVLEEIYEPDSTFSAMNRLLASGGYLLHKIDLSDYGIFRDRGMHPLTFLTIPDWIYRLMASDAGIPNRRRIGYYQRRMAELGYDAKFFVTSVLGTGPLEPHKQALESNIDYSQATLDLISQVRPQLSRKFRHLNDEELLIDGIFMVARRAEKTD